MTTDYVSVPAGGTVHDAVSALRVFEGDLEIVTDIFLVDDEGHLSGIVGLARMALADSSTPLAAVREPRTHTCTVDATSKEIAELFDKYNLRSLVVLDHDKTMVGVIYPEHIIALLRAGR